MNEDMSEFLGVFLDEATEQIALLEQAFLQLEQAASPPLLQEIFRAAHTLKGSSRAMGFLPMGELTHALEDVFDGLRQGKLAVSDTLMEALFGGLDALKTMQAEIAVSGAANLDTAQQTARLRAILPDSSQTTQKKTASVSSNNLGAEPNAACPAFHVVLTASQLTAIQDAESVGCPVYGLVVRFAPDCVMKSVRAHIVLQELAARGMTLALLPDEDALESEAFDDCVEMEIVFACEQEADALRDALLKINEIRDVQVTLWQSAPTPLIPPPHGEGTIEPPLSPALPAQPVSALPEAPSPVVGEREAERAPTLPAKPAAMPQSPTVRVDVARLDRLLNLVGELIIDQTRVARACGQLTAHVGGPHLEPLHEAAAHIGRIAEDLQAEIMKARMLPIDSVFSRFPRMIRDLAAKLDKEIHFVVEGKDTELDRSVIEVIADPLIHMLRNSVDHGIESPEVREQAGKPRIGTVALRARHQENYIVIEIQDDGKGLDPAKLRAGAVSKGLLTPEAADRMTDSEAIHLIFASGFSTAQTVSDISGRGVGMDIVKNNLERIGARVEIDSVVGVGTTFLIKMPLTLAIIRGLLVEVCGCVYVLPLNCVVETRRMNADAVHSFGQRELVYQEGQTLPLARLRDFFSLDAATTPAEQTLRRERQQISEVSGLQSEAPCSTLLETTPYAENRLYLVVVGVGGQQTALVVDALLGEQEVAIKPLGNFVGAIRGIAGATILGDGRMALIVDVPDLTTAILEERGKVPCRRM